MRGTCTVPRVVAVGSARAAVRPCPSAREHDTGSVYRYRRLRTSRRLPAPSVMVSCEMRACDAQSHPEALARAPPDKWLSSSALRVKREAPGANTTTLNTCTVWRRCDATLMRAAPTCRQLPRAARFPTRRAAERCPWRRVTLSLRRGTARGRRSGERCFGGAAGARALRAARRRRCARASPRRPSLRAAWRWRPAVTTGSARGSSASRVRACARARGGGRHEAHAQAPEESFPKASAWI